MSGTSGYGGRGAHGNPRGRRRRATRTDHPDWDSGDNHRAARRSAATHYAGLPGDEPADDPYAVQRADSRYDALSGPRTGDRYATDQLAGNGWSGDRRTDDRSGSAARGAEDAYAEARRAADEALAAGHRANEQRTDDRSSAESRDGSNDRAQYDGSGRAGHRAESGYAGDRYQDNSITGLTDRAGTSYGGEPDGVGGSAGVDRPAENGYFGERDSFSEPVGAERRAEAGYTGNPFVTDRPAADRYAEGRSAGDGSGGDRYADASRSDLLGVGALGVDDGLAGETSGRDGRDAERRGGRGRRGRDAEGSRAQYGDRPGERSGGRRTQVAGEPGWEERTDELDLDLGLRPESRAERRVNRRKQRSRRGFGCLAGLLSLAVVGALLAGLMVGFGRGRDYLEQVFAAPDYVGDGSGSVTVEVTRGQSAQAIADTLEKKDVVKSAKAFSRAARDDPRSVQIQAATYSLRRKMSAQAALALMLDPAESVRVTRVGVQPGWTKEVVVQRLQANKQVPLPAGSVAAALAKPETLGLPSYAQDNPEGFLYPGTYDVPKDATAYTILRQLTGQFAKTQAELKLPEVAQRKKLDPYQAVIVASIIAAETNRSEDYPKVARVIYNRLQRNMRLQMDSTVHYVAGRNGGVFTSDEERDLDSPYNTYKYTGLPPTPINSPGKETLRAALYAEPGPWLYFTLVNLDTGETAFAATASEHQANVRKLQAWCQANTGRC